MLPVIRYLLFLLLVPALVYSQQIPVQLSPLHTQKLNKTTNSTRKLLLYQKYYRADSATQTKQALAAADQQTDSLLNATLIAKTPGTDSLQQMVKLYKSVLTDTTLSDSAKSVMTIRLRQLASDKLSLDPAVETLFDQHIKKGDSVSWRTLVEKIPSLDSIGALFNSDPEALFSSIESRLSDLLLQNDLLPASSGAKATLLQDVIANPLSQLPQVPMDGESLKDELKQKAEHAFEEMISTGSSSLVQAQARVGELLNKYRSFTNSEDLKGSVKQTSLQGKNFRERVVLGTDFQVITLTPFSIDVALKAGYRFNSRAYAGTALNYRFASRDSIPSLKQTAPENTSYRVFGSYEIARSYFVTTEWERNHRVDRNGDRKQVFKSNNFFIGVGKRMLVHPKLYLTVTALCNLSRQEDTSIYRQRFQLRTGFQLSELATRCKKNYYNPNR